MYTHTCVYIYIYTHTHTYTCAVHYADPEFCQVTVGCGISQ